MEVTRKRCCCDELKMRIDALEREQERLRGVFFVHADNDAEGARQRVAHAFLNGIKRQMEVLEGVTKGMLNRLNVLERDVCFFDKKELEDRDRHIADKFEEVEEMLGETRATVDYVQDSEVKNLDYQVAVMQDSLSSFKNELGELNGVVEAIQLQI